MESVIPVFLTKALDDVLEFYQALGFAVTYRQDKPYIYAAVQRGEINIHFTKGSTPSGCLVHVPDVATYHRAFASGLRDKYGRVPTRDVPRLTRFREGQTRFTLYDPAGNTLMFINQDEPDIDYDAYDDSLSPLMQALENVRFLRDTYHDDASAARFLDRKLREHATAAPIDRARALAARAELAVAMEDMEQARIIREALQQLPLTADERAQHHAELQAAERLEHWLTEREESSGE